MLLNADGLYLKKTFDEKDYTGGPVQAVNGRPAQSTAFAEHPKMLGRRLRFLIMSLQGYLQNVSPTQSSLVLAVQSGSDEDIQRLNQLAATARSLASSLAISSVIARGSESDEYEDIAIYLGSGDYSNAPDVIEALGIKESIQVDLIFMHMPTSSKLCKDHPSATGCEQSTSRCQHAMGQSNRRA